MASNRNQQLVANEQYALANAQKEAILKKAAEKTPWPATLIREQNEKEKDDDKLERASELIWKDRSHKYNQAVRHENQLLGRIGGSAFTLDIQKHMEDRFNKNLKDRMSSIEKNAKKA